MKFVELVLDKIHFDSPATGKAIITEDGGGYGDTEESCLAFFQLEFWEEATFKDPAIQKAWNELIESFDRYDHEEVENKIDTFLKDNFCGSYHNIFKVEFDVSPSVAMAYNLFYIVIDMRCADPDYSED